MGRRVVLDIANFVPLHEILGEKHRDNQGEVVCGYHDKQGMA
jgi:hypothetical protein